MCKDLSEPHALCHKSSTGTAVQTPKSAIAQQTVGDSGFIQQDHPAYSNDQIPSNYQPVSIRVVNIAVLVSLPILSAILLEYWHDYCRYFSSVVSKWVSAILFQLFFGNTRYQYFCQQAAPLRPVSYTHLTLPTKRIV